MDSQDQAAADHRVLQKTRWKIEYLQRFPCAVAEIGKQFSIIHEISTQNYRDAEDEMPVGNLSDILENSFIIMFPF